MLTINSTPHVVGLGKIMVYLDIFSPLSVLNIYIYITMFLYFFEMALNGFFFFFLPYQ